MHEEEGAWDCEENVYPEFGEVQIPDFSSDLKIEDERAFNLFRKVLEGVFSEIDEPQAEQTIPRKRKQKETKPAKDGKPARRRAIPKSPPTRRVLTPR